jgi:cyclic pyranopterin phosphate synthase
VLGPIGFTANGQLLTRESIGLTIEAGLDEITLSTHEIKKVPTEALMKGGSFANYHRNLRTIVDLKRTSAKKTGNSY